MKIDGTARNTLGKNILIAGIVCVAVAFIIIAYNLITDVNAGNFTSSVMVKIKDYIDSEKTKAEENTDNAAVPFQGYNFMGYLNIPELSLNLPVMSDWNYDKLNVSPCRYSGSVLTSDLVIAAHNYSSHFGNIYQLKKGDKVSFTDMTGDTYKYEVSYIDTLKPVEVNKMTSGECALSLFTCDWTGTARVTVRCDRMY